MKKRDPSETIERVVMGPTGELALGIRLRFMDKYHAEPLANMEGYTLFLEPHNCDAWAISGGQAWVVVTGKSMKRITDLGPL